MKSPRLVVAIVCLGLLMALAGTAQAAAPSRGAPPVTSKWLLEHADLPDAFEKALRKDARKGSGKATAAGRRAATAHARKIAAARRAFENQERRAAAWGYVGSYWTTWPWYYDLYYDVLAGWGAWLADLGWCDGVTYCGTYGEYWIYWEYDRWWYGPFYY